MRALVLRRILVVSLILWLAVTARSVAAGQPAPPTSPTVAIPETSPTAAARGATSPVLVNDPVAIKWLRTLEERHKDHRRATGKFRQTKIDPVFQEKIEAGGRFYYERPNSFRCDYEKPEPSTNLVIGDRVLLYFPKFKQAERYHLARNGSGIGEVNEMLLAFGIETDKILKYFTVLSDPVTSADVVRLTFLPKSRREDRPFARFVLELSKTDLSPKRFEITGDEQDVTVVEVTEIKWNDPSMPPDIFQLNLPRDVEMIEQE